MRVGMIPTSTGGSPRKTQWGVATPSCGRCGKNVYFAEQVCPRIFFPAFENMLSESFTLRSLEVAPTDILMNRLKQLEKRSTKPVYGVLTVVHRSTRIS